ncbi:MAG: gluconolactonase [Acetobacteraceae bacterium]|jgi:gluconolactonase|nr:gluconolactonase [Acetobacteraceae bacterium]MEA2791883.1 gluconolactonase [Acetobacteraceae bacterium]
MTTLSDILETKTPEKIAGGFKFTEGPLWHPDGFFYFVDLPSNLLYRMVPGQAAEKVRDTLGGNGTTFDLQGRLLNCEGEGRRVTRGETDGTVTTLIDRFEGKRLNRPNDVICHSNGSILFTDPEIRVPLADREIGHAAVYRIAPDGGVSEVAKFEYPNGLALSPDERTLFVANTRWTQYIHALELDPWGNVSRRRVFADMSADGTNGVPDGMKVDEAGRVFCTGTGGVWVFEPNGTRIGIIETPEVCANIAFGGADLRMLLLTATSSIYSLQVKVPGLPHPWYGVRG